MSATLIAPSSDVATENAASGEDCVDDVGGSVAARETLVGDGAASVDLPIESKDVESIGAVASLSTAEHFPASDRPQPVVTPKLVDDDEDDDADEGDELEEVGEEGEDTPGFNDDLDDEEDDFDEFDDIDEDDFDDDFDDDFEEELDDDYVIEIDDEISAEFGLNTAGESDDDEIDDDVDDFEDFDAID